MPKLSGKRSSTAWWKECYLRWQGGGEMVTWGSRDGVEVSSEL
jgi:hypothetical protein